MMNFIYLLGNYFETGSDCSCVDSDDDIRTVLHLSGKKIVTLVGEFFFVFWPSETDMFTAGRCCWAEFPIRSAFYRPRTHRSGSVRVKLAG